MGILSVMMTVTKNSVDPQLEWQAMMIGDAIIREVLDKKNDFPQGCVAKSNLEKFVSICDYHGIKNVQVEKVFPELSKNLPKSLFDVSIEIKQIEPSEKNQDNALIVISVHNQHLGQVVFSAIKAKGNDTNAQDSRVYIY